MVAAAEPSIYMALLRTNAAVREIAFAAAALISDATMRLKIVRHSGPYVTLR